MEKKKAPKKAYKTTEIVVVTPSLPAAKQAMIQVATPTEFIKERKGKGNKVFKYVEGGYVVAQLNKIFSPIGWDFEVLNERIDNVSGNVSVRGRLTVKDFKTGYSVGKTNTGSKEKVLGMSLEDMIKSATTDCLKRCASMYGIALDVYWQAFENETSDEKGSGSKNQPAGKSQKSSEKPKTVSYSDVILIARKKIQDEDDKTILAQFKSKIMDSPIIKESDKGKLVEMIDGKLGI